MKRIRVLLVALGLAIGTVAVAAMQYSGDPPCPTCPPPDGPAGPPA